MLSVFVAGVVWGTTIALLLLSGARMYGGDELAFKLGKALPIPLDCPHDGRRAVDHELATAAR